MSITDNPTNFVEASRILQTEAPKEDDTVVIRRALNMYHESAMHPVWVDWRRNASTCYNYREGEQYTAAELTELADRGQPATVQNELLPYEQRLVGQVLATRNTTSFIGRNTPADDDTASVLADLQRFVDQNNQYEFIEPKVAHHGITSGIGWLRVDVTTNELGQPSIYETDEDPFNFFPDPFFKKRDLSDCRYICYSKWIDVEDAIALAPEKESKIMEAVLGRDPLLAEVSGIDPRLITNPMFAFIDPDRKRIRPVEFWYRRKMKRYQIFTPDGSTAITMPLGKDDLKAITSVLPKSAYIDKPVVVDQMWCGMFAGGVLLYHHQSPRRHQKFPWVPLIIDQKKNGEPFGKIFNGISIQDAINKRESKAINMLSNRRIVAEQGAIENPVDAQTENAKADGYIEVTNGALANGRVQFPDNHDIGQAQVVLLQNAKAALPRVMGVPDEMMGHPSEIRSGIGVAKKQQMGGLIQSPMITSVREYRFNKARLMMELIKEVFTAPMTFQVTDDPAAARLVELTSSHVEAIKARIYDVVITDAPDYTTLREQELDMMFTLLPQAANLGPGMMKFALSLTNLREKKALMGMLDQAMQAPPQLPKLSLSMTWAELSDEEKSFIALAAMQSPELAQFLAQRADDPAWKAKIKADLAKTQIKEGTRAQIEHGRVDYQAMATAMEGMQRSREISIQEKVGLTPQTGGTDVEGITNPAP